MSHTAEQQARELCQQAIQTLEEPLRATALAQQALALWSDADIAHHTLGRLAGTDPARIPHFQAAIEAIERRMKNPDLEPELQVPLRHNHGLYHLELAVCLWNTKAYTEAVTTLEKVLCRVPDEESFFAHVTLLQWYLELGQTDPALALCRGLLELDPTDTIATYQRSLLSFLQYGNSSISRGWLRHAVEATPEIFLELSQTSTHGDSPETRMIRSSWQNAPGALEWLQSMFRYQKWEPYIPPKLPVDLLAGILLAEKACETSLAEALAGRLVQQGVRPPEPAGQGRGLDPTTLHLGTRILFREHHKLASEEETSQKLAATIHRAEQLTQVGASILEMHCGPGETRLEALATLHQVITILQSDPQVLNTLATLLQNAGYRGPLEGSIQRLLREWNTLHTSLPAETIPLSPNLPASDD